MAVKRFMIQGSQKDGPKCERQIYGLSFNRGWMCQVWMISNAIDHAGTKEDLKGLDENYNRSSWFE